MPAKPADTPALDLVRKQAEIRRELQSIHLGNKPETKSLPKEISAIIEFIHTHLFDSSLNVNAVKQSCRIRNNNVSTRFRLSMGIGIREYIEVLRLEAASRLILCCDFELYLIGMAVGYEHQETFCRAYHRHFGKPPSSCKVLPPR